jgi:hypothetical protein
MRGIKRAMRAMRSALVISVVVPGILALAQSNGVAQDLMRPMAGGWATAGMLTPADIIVEVRRAGFVPVSRPIQRGPVYVLLALDNGDIDVKLTVDARSGRVLWVSDVIGARYGGYYGYPALPHYGRPPVPPSDIPNIGPGRNNFGPDRTTASVRHSPPLPRTRPAELTRAVNKESAPPPAAPTLPPPAGGGGKGGVTTPPAQSATSTAAASRPGAAPEAKSQPAPPTMVPIAPLE